MKRLSNRKEYFFLEKGYKSEGFVNSFASTHYYKLLDVMLLSLWNICRIFCFTTWDGKFCSIRISIFQLLAQAWAEFRSCRLCSTQVFFTCRVQSRLEYIVSDDEYVKDRLLRSIKASKVFSYQFFHLQSFMCAWNLVLGLVNISG